MSSKKALRTKLDIVRGSAASAQAEATVHEANAEAWRAEAQRLRSELDAKAAAPAQPAPAAPPPPPVSSTPIHDEYAKLQRENPYLASQFLLNNEQALAAEGLTYRQRGR